MTTAKTTVAAGQTGILIPKGTRLNGIYEIEEVIGQGGMGMVYRGRAIETGDPVAIKVIRAEMAQNDAALALFRKEAAVLHTLLHEAIVRYYLFTRDPEIDRPYLATEFVDGTQLSDVISRGTLARADVLALAARLADGLQAAHKLSIIHRDISPDNVILPGGDVRRAKIIDFGIARASMIGGGTLIGDQIAGKFDYMSPEQLGLYGGEVTARSDIYSLGIVLAEAALGRQLDMGGTQVQVVEKRRSVPDLSPIEPKLRALLSSMLQPKPGDRPKTMTAVAEAARAMGAVAPSKAKTVGGMRSAAVAAVLALLAAGGAYVGVNAWPEAADGPEPAPELQQVTVASEAPQAAEPRAGPERTDAFREDADADGRGGGGGESATGAGDAPTLAAADPGDPSDPGVPLEARASTSAATEVGPDAQDGEGAQAEIAALSPAAQSAPGSDREVIPPRDGDASAGSAADGDASTVPALTPALGDDPRADDSGEQDGRGPASGRPATGDGSVEDGAPNSTEAVSSDAERPVSARTPNRGEAAGPDAGLLASEEAPAFTNGSRAVREEEDRGEVGSGAQVSSEGSGAAEASAATPSEGIAGASPSDGDPSGDRSPAPPQLTAPQDATDDPSADASDAPDVAGGERAPSAGDRAPTERAQRDDPNARPMASAQLDGYSSAEAEPEQRVARLTAPDAAAASSTREETAAAGSEEAASSAGDRASQATPPLEVRPGSGEEASLEAARDPFSPRASGSPSNEPAARTQETVPRDGEPRLSALEDSATDEPAEASGARDTDADADEASALASLSPSQDQRAKVPDAPTAAGSDVIAGSEAATGSDARPPPGTIAPRDAATEPPGSAAEPQAAQGESVDLASIDPQSPYAPAGQPEDGVTRYVRQYDGGPCTYLRAREVGPQSAQIEAYGDEVDPFQAFNDDFQRSLGFEADIGVRLIEEAQCPAVEFVRRLSPRRDDPLTLQLDNDVIRSGTALTGAISGLEDRALELFVIANDGQVYPLTQMTTRTRNSAALHTAIRGAQDTPPQPHLVLALAGLTMPKIAERPAPAAQFFPALGDALAGEESANAQLGYFMFGG